MENKIGSVDIPEDAIATKCIIILPKLKKNSQNEVVIFQHGEREIRFTSEEFMDILSNLKDIDWR
jgi:hypothetical protein